MTNMQACQSLVSNPFEKRFKLYLKLWTLAAPTTPAVAPAMAATAVAAVEAAAMAVSVDVDDEEDSCITSFDDLNKLCPVSLQ